MPTQAGLGLTQISKHAEHDCQAWSPLERPSVQTFPQLPQLCFLRDQRTVGRTVGEWPETGSSLVCHFPHPAEQSSSQASAELWRVAVVAAGSFVLRKPLLSLTGY